MQPSVPLDLQATAQASRYPDTIEKFSKMRTLDPTGTEASLSKVHRNYIFKLDGRDGERGATWHDVEHAVAWLLAFSPEHDLQMMVDRTATRDARGLGGPNELLPSVAQRSAPTELSGDSRRDARRAGTKACSWFLQL